MSQFTFTDSEGKELDISEYKCTLKIKPIVKPENDYSQNGHIAWMPSKAIISHYFTDGSVKIFYPDKTIRWIKHDFFDDDYLKQL